MIDKTPKGIEGSGNLGGILTEWAGTLEQVLESMTDHRPEIQWQSITGPLNEAAEQAGAGMEEQILWWEQPFQLLPEAAVWVGAPRATWEYAGALTLKAAGLETVEAAESKSTWFEILGQALGALARSMGALVGREVGCGAGVERGPDPSAREWAAVAISFPEATLAPLLFTLSPQLQAALSSAAGKSVESAPAAASQPPEPSGAGGSSVSRTMDLLLDVDLPISISFGRAQLPMNDVLKLTTGSIVELNRGISEHVEVLVNQCLIARGEVVVVEGNYAVRIQQIVSREDRLRSLR